MDSAPALRDVLVLGAGKVGTTAADMLATHHPDLRVTLAGRGDEPAPACAAVARVALDAADAAALDALLARHDAVVDALPFHLALRVAEAAARRGVHCLNLTEDVEATAAIRGLAASARSLLLPQCGLAPGVIGMLGAHLAARFDELHDLRLRVGALTRHDGGGLHYAFTWSVEGVLNEYLRPCRAVVGGDPVWLQPLEGLETLKVGGEAFEAFNTSGGLGGLCEALRGRVRNLDYKTLRHPGHRDAMHLLLHGLRLAERRDLLREVLLHAVPHSRDDMVIVHATATGLRRGRLEEETRSARILGGVLAGTARTAIELSTAAGVVGAFELLRAGVLPRRGFLGPEQVPFEAFLRTRVGHHYAALADPPQADAAGAAAAGDEPAPAGLPR